MLVLSRKVGEKIKIGENIEVIVIGYSCGHIRLAIKAPLEMKITREEHYPLEQTKNPTNQ